MPDTELSAVEDAWFLFFSQPYKLGIVIIPVLLFRFTKEREAQKITWLILTHTSSVSMYLFKE